MPPQSGSTNLETLPSSGRVHVLGARAGPVGLLLAALLQSLADVDVRLYEKRPAYRGRMVQLRAPFLVAEFDRSPTATDPDRRRQRRGGLRFAGAPQTIASQAVHSVGRG